MENKRLPLGETVIRKIGKNGNGGYLISNDPTLTPEEILQMLGTQGYLFVQNDSGDTWGVELNTEYDAYREPKTKRIILARV